MTKKVSIFMIFMLFTQLFGNDRALASSVGFRSLIDAQMTFITQSEGGPRACGPTALLYSFKLGNSQMRAAYAKISGHSDSEKLKNIVQNFGRKSSQTTYHSQRLDPKNGMAPLDVFATAHDLLANRRDNFVSVIQSQTLNRAEAETEAGTFLKRVHSVLKKSVSANVPPVAIIVPYLGTFDSEKNVTVWSEQNGHYVVITGIAEQIPGRSLGVNIEYLDPETGQANQAFLFEEVERTFWARLEKGDGSSHWLHPKVNYRGKQVSSPYLSISAPGLNLLPRGLKDGQRLVLTLVTAIGQFEDKVQTPTTQPTQAIHPILTSQIEAPLQKL